MIVMRKGLQERLLARAEASSAHGKGFVYITDKAVAYEVDGHGMYLNFVPHGVIKKIAVASGMMGTKKFRVEWDEDGETTRVFEFRARDHESLRRAMGRAGIL